METLPLPIAGCPHTLQSDAMVPRPLISIITVNRNNAAGLRRTLASTTEQSYAEFEHLVVDGASTDGSTAVMSEFHDKLAHAVSERDTGIYNAMNKGIAAARGEFLLFLNSGDHLLDAESLGTAAKHLGEHDLCYFDLEIRDAGTRNVVPGRVLQYPDVLRLSHFVASSLPHPACFIRRSLFERFGGYDESLKICADWKAFVLWVCKHRCTYKHVPQTLSVFYADGLSSHAASRGTIEAERQQVLGAEFATVSQDAADALEAREALILVAALRRSRAVRCLQAIGVLWKF